MQEYLSLQANLYCLRHERIINLITLKLKIIQQSVETEKIIRNCLAFGEFTAQAYTSALTGAATPIAIAVSRGHWEAPHSLRKAPALAMGLLTSLAPITLVVA